MEPSSDDAPDRERGGGCSVASNGKPAPSTALLAALGLGAVALLRRRR
jgi:MYXO-CTERM domain-containing protein